jgi:hypothetical protein
MVAALLRWTVSAVLVGLASHALARSDAEVEGLQMPAWIVRDSERTALRVGMQLRDRDQIKTGAASRVLLRMGDGSTVKLGENARFSLDGMRQQTQRQGNLFRASLNVIEGAFRFTTQAVYRFRGRREVDVHFVTATAGIRGTDLWGKSGSDQEIVCLIEGKITLARTGRPPLAMGDAGTVYRARRDAAPGRVEPVDPAELARWAAETEIAAGGGAVRKGGAWKLYLLETSSRSSARAAADRLRGDGFYVQLETAATSQAALYRVYVGGFPDSAEARALASRLRGRPEVAETTISK